MTENVHSVPAAEAAMPAPVRESDNPVMKGLLFLRSSAAAAPSLTRGLWQCYGRERAAAARNFLGQYRPHPALYLTLALAGQWIEVNFWNMFFSIVVVVLLPILLGLGVHAVVGEKLEKIKKVLVLVSTVCILLVIGMCVGPNQSSFTQNGLTVVVVTMLAVLLHHVLGLVAGYAIARVFRFNEAKTRALSLEVGLQNSGLSCTLAASAFPGTLAVLPCVLATVVHQVVGPVVANLFAARDTKPAKAPAGSAEAAEA